MIRLHVRQNIHWIGILVMAGIPRITAAILLPNEEGDPYSYLQAIEFFQAKLGQGSLTMADLYGFWLPLYQVLCAIVSNYVGHPLLVAKCFSAICGIGICMLVLLISLQLTANKNFAFFAAALVALNPTHILYSAFSMTDIPHAFLVMCNLYFAIKQRWLAASLFVALGSLMRVESWMFILLLPTLQFLRQRRISLTVCGILALAPLLWFYICWAATGNPFAYFKVRSEYINDFFAASPDFTYYAWSRIAANMWVLFFTTGYAVIMASLTSIFLIGKLWVRKTAAPMAESAFAFFAAAIYFFSYFGFLLFAYFSKNQPDIWARYCLLLFTIGTAILVWTFLTLKEWKPAWATKVLLSIIALSFWQWSFQFIDGVSFVRQTEHKYVIAHYLTEQYKAEQQHFRILCDDLSVRALSGIPADHYLNSTDSPDDVKVFQAYLKENRVEFLVYTKRDSLLLENFIKAAGEESPQNLLHLILRLGPQSTYSEIRLYRIRESHPEITFDSGSR